MISFKTDSIIKLMERFENEGTPILSGPLELTVQPLGKIRRIEVEGPSKVRIEFFEQEA